MNFRVIGRHGTQTAPCDSPDTLRTRFGGRRLAVQLTPPQEIGDAHTISAVYGVEPLFTGYEPQSPGGDAVVEGTVVAFDPTMDVPALSPNPTPMVKLALHPNNAGDPALTIWIPSYRPTRPFEGGTSDPQPGDVVQTRIVPELHAVTLGEEDAVLALPAALASTETFLMRPAPEREQLAIERHAETAALLAAISTADPTVLAEALGTYLEGRYQTFTVLGNGPHTMSRLDLTRDELAAITAAVEGRSLANTELPISYWLLATPSALAGILTTSHPVESLQALSARLVDADELPIDTNLLAQTVGQAQRIALRIINQIEQLEPCAPDLFEPLLELLDPQSRDATIDSAIGRFDAASTDPDANLSWKYVRSVPEIHQIVSSMRTHADNRQREYIDGKVCDSLASRPDTASLLGLDRTAARTGGYQMLIPLITTADYAVAYQDASRRATYNISDEQYNSWRVTARHFLTAIHRMGWQVATDVLTTEHMQTVDRLQLMRDAGTL